MFRYELLLKDIVVVVIADFRDADDNDHMKEQILYISLKERFVLQ